MIKTETVQKEFTAKLQALLAEYGAELYGEMNRNRPVIEVYIPTLHNKEGVIVREFTNFTIVTATAGNIITR